jgi:hypothetical protein
MKALFPILVCVLLSLSCRYIVLPEGIEKEQASAEDKGWIAVPTAISKSEAGDLHIDITIRNETGDWSGMKAVDGKPAVLTTDGKTTNCDTVFVGTGGHRLAPGFQMRGYMTGKKAEPKTQMLYVECKGAEAAPGSKLSVDYVSYSGELDYYHQENGEAFGTLEMDLDQLATDLTYPIYQPVEGLIQPPDVQITAISDNVITLEDVQRIEKGLQFTWQNYNPTEFALKTHIGDPPVIGENGIIYGIFEIMDIVSVPLSPAGGEVQWTTEQAVPADEKGFYILLSVESKQMRLYISYAVDITNE